MAEPKAVGVRVERSPIPGEIDSVVPFRRGARGSAPLPAMWGHQTPADIVMEPLAVLFAMLHLECAYARSDDPDGGSMIERWLPDGPQVPAELARGPRPAEAHQRGSVTESEAVRSGHDHVHVMRISAALLGETSVVLVGSRRHDFPTNLELHAIRVTVGQAAHSMHLARRLADERAARVAAETALRQRNRFLAELADDLTLPVGRLAVRAAQAHAFAAESVPSLALASRESNPAMSTAVTPEPQASVRPATSSTPLTRRETEVLGLLAQGLSNKEIAEEMWLSERTVERHITGLYRKIGVERRSQATAFALRQGFVESDGQAG